MSTCNSNEARPAKRTRLSSWISPPLSHSVIETSDQEVQDETESERQLDQVSFHQDDHSNLSNPKLNSQPVCPPINVLDASSTEIQTADVPDQKSLIQEPAGKMDSLPIDVDDPPPHQSRADLADESSSNPGLEDSLTPLTEEDSPDCAPITEALENDLEISQYDIWSDYEKEEIDVFDEADVQDTQPDIIHQEVPVEKLNPLPLDEQVSSSQQSSHHTLPTVNTDHPTSAKNSEHGSFHPSSSVNQRSSQVSNLCPSQSQDPTRAKRTVSSLFTTGGGQPFPLDPDLHLISPSPSQKKIKDSNVSLPSSSDSRWIRRQDIRSPKPSARNTPEANGIYSENRAQPGLDIPELRRTSSSIFRTGTGQPYRLDAQDGKESLLAENERCPVFGLQTASGNAVPAPSKETIRKALDLCTTDRAPFSKRLHKEPDSPSPLHRVPLQKAPHTAVLPSIHSPPIKKDQTTSNSLPLFKTASSHQNLVLIPNSGSSTSNTPTIKANRIISSSELFSTGAGAPVNISPSAVERVRARLDDPSLPLEPSQPSANASLRPLKDVSNVRHRNLTNGSNIHQGIKISLQPYTTSSLMSTPSREAHRGAFSAGLVSTSNEPNSLRPAHHTTTAPVRRISNRMHVGLTPQSSRRISHETEVHKSQPFVTPFKKSVQFNNLKSVQSNPRSTPAPDLQHLFRDEDTPSSEPFQRSVLYMNLNSYNRQGSSGKPQSVFDLSTRSGQSIPMAVWLASPKGYSSRHLLSLAVPESVVFMTAKSAAVWNFNALTEPFGAIQALGELLEAGCMISKSNPKWVANHWGLIVWKLAGMVRWQPDCLSRVWNPSNVVRQLKYRYEREFVCDHRSVIKRILDRDCSSIVPMCLVIVGIHRSSSRASLNDNLSSSSQILELSDGWYKIKAVIDPVLSRTLTRRALKVGHKLAISGATTEAPKTSIPNGSRKNANPQNPNSREEDSDELMLFLEGNSTSRAKWHESLGFRPRSWFASIRSLTHDGGKIAMMDIRVIKVFPLKFMDEDGRLGRWGQAEENMLQIAWEKERERESAKIVNEQERKLERLQEVFESISSIYSNRMQGRTSADTTTEKNSPLADFDAEEMCEELIDGEAGVDALKPLSVGNLGELRNAIERQTEAFRKSSMDELLKNLNARVPIRRIRHVQVLQIQDFKLFKHQGSNQRFAQLHVQDLNQLPYGFFKEGHRYWVQNLQPQRRSQWDAKLDQVEVLLSTRRDTHWKKVDLND